jgi:hypothetical protein
MNYNEVSNDLQRLATTSSMPARTVETQGLRTTAVYVIPERWFVAFESAGALFLGPYEGQDLRMVGTSQHLYENLIIDIIDREFRSALAELPACYLAVNLSGL